jgi:hypothetical protein
VKKWDSRIPSSAPGIKFWRKPLWSEKAALSNFKVSPFFQLFVTQTTTIKSLIETATVGFGIITAIPSSCQTTGGAVATHVLTSSEGNQQKQS